MTGVLFVYNRIGQMACFLIAIGGVFMMGDDPTLANAVFAVGYLLGGVGLKALHVWQSMRDPARQ